MKMSGSTYTQRALLVEVSTMRAIEELLEQHRLEVLMKEKVSYNARKESKKHKNSNGEKQENKRQKCNKLK